MVMYPKNVQSLFGYGVNFTGASLSLIVLILFVICVVVAATFEAEVRETSLKSTLSLLPMIKENKEMWFFSHIAGGLVWKKYVYTEMQKVADMAVISVLFFPRRC